MNILTIKDVKKKFNQKEVLKGLNLEIPEHSIFGFVGKNGAGKTTTMKAILGLLKIDEGQIKIYDEPVFYGDNKTNRFIGYLPDVPEFYGYMTAHEYLALCGKAMGLSNEKITTKTDELLTLVGLKNEKSRIKGYSRGMKQRLGIAQALIGEPKLLICDEPTSALDPIGRKEILDILSSIKKNTTVLFSTHILSDVERICTHVAFLDDGIIKLQGKIEELKKINRGSNYKLELLDDVAIEKVLLTFKDIKKEDNYLIVPSENLNKVLAFVLKEDIKFSKVEAIEIDLETFFMEVTTK